MPVAESRGFDECRAVKENSESASYKSGPVAQLGARFHGMEEVTGSIPVRSTNYFNNLPLCLTRPEGGIGPILANPVKA